MRYFPSLLPAAALLACLPAAALDPMQPRGRQVLRDAVAAMGGARFLDMRDRVETGWVSSWHGSTTRHFRARIYTLYDAAGVMERRAFDKDEAHAILFNENGAFEITWRGARPLGADRAAEYREHRAHNVVDLLRRSAADPGLIAEYRGADKCENQSADFVVITDAENRVTTVCFSRATRLPVKAVYYRRDPETRERRQETVIYSRYTESDGITLPRMIQRLRDGDPVEAMFVETAAVNQAVPRERFVATIGK